MTDSDEKPARISGLDLTVEYTNNDDGLWLVCPHPGETERYISLGYFPTVGDILDAARKHIADKHPLRGGT